MISDFVIRHDKDNRASLTDWITAIYSIFWSVWWGFFMEKVFINGTSNITLQDKNGVPFNIPILYYLIINIILIVLFCFFYVKWLWHAQRAAICATFARDLLVSLFLFYLISVPLLISVSLMYYSKAVSVYMVLYGLFLILAWPLSVVLVLWRTF